MRPTSVYYRLSTAVRNGFETAEKGYDSEDHPPVPTPPSSSDSNHSKTVESETVQVETVREGTAIVDTLKRMQTPATVDELTDRLLDRRDGVDRSTRLDAWATVHERLHERDLPELDASGVIEFDASKGLVGFPTDGDTHRPLGQVATPGRIALVGVSLGLLLLPLLSVLPPAVDVLSVLLAVLGLIASVKIL